MTQAANQIAPLFSDLSPYEAKKQINQSDLYFNQGLIFFWGSFYHEAIRSFKAALDHNPLCGSCYFMLALSNCSISDQPFDGQERRVSIELIDYALKSIQLTEQSRDLITSLFNRYYKGAVQKPSVFTFENTPITSENERASFAESMRDLLKKYPEDQNIKMLFAYSLFDLINKQFWTDRFANSDTQDLLRTLYGILKKSPNHPGAMHLLMQVLSRSSNSDEATLISEKLIRLYPNIPYFAYDAAKLSFQQGKFHQASDLMMQSLGAYYRYQKQCEAQGFNSHAGFSEQRYLETAWITALFEGRYQFAKEIAKQLKTITPSSLVDQIPMLEWYLTADLFIEIYFQHWEKLLAMPKPPEQQYFRQGIWYYGSALALMQRGQQSEANLAYKNLAALIIAKEKSLEKLHLKQLEIAKKILSAKLASEENRTTLSDWQTILQSIQNDDPRAILWMTTAQQGLANLYQQKNQNRNSIESLNDFLNKHPNNPWILHQLSQLYEVNGELKKSTELHLKLIRIWRYADEPLAALSD